MQTQIETSSIPVTIGQQMRCYRAFVTTAPESLDGPSTVTLYTSTFGDVAGFAADPLPFDGATGAVPARLVLIPTTELAWQRTRYQSGQFLLAPIDPVLVGPRTLQQWLWNRLTVRADLSA